MNANIVYSVAKALPKEEFQKLYALLKDDLQLKVPTTSKKKQKLISRAEADAFILKTVFNKKS